MPFADAIESYLVSRAGEVMLIAAVVQGYDTWTLNRRDSKAFVDALINPPEPNEALRAAAALHEPNNAAGLQDALGELGQ